MVFGQGRKRVYEEKGLLCNEKMKCWLATIVYFGVQFENVDIIEFVVV